VRQAKATAGVMTQDANTNCLTRYVVGSNPVLPTWAPGTAYAIGGTSGSGTPSWSTAVDGLSTDGAPVANGGIVWVNLGTVTQAQILPGVTPNSNLMPVSYPNTEQNALYYGSLTGLCWVENYGKMYTADGGQIHAFNTIDGSERNNINITIQGTVFDVAYMDALTNAAN
jgi:hypothetical protein